MSCTSQHEAHWPRLAQVVTQQAALMTTAQWALDTIKWQTVLVVERDTSHLPLQYSAMKCHMNQPSLTQYPGGHSSCHSVHSQ